MSFASSATSAAPAAPSFSRDARERRAAGANGRPAGRWRRRATSAGSRRGGGRRRLQRPALARGIQRRDSARQARGLSRGITLKCGGRCLPRGCAFSEIAGCAGLLHRDRGRAYVAQDAELSRKERGHRGVRPATRDRQPPGDAGGGFLKRLRSASICVRRARSVARYDLTVQHKPRGRQASTWSVRGDGRESRFRAASLITRKNQYVRTLTSTPSSPSNN